MGRRRGIVTDEIKSAVAGFRENIRNDEPNLSERSLDYQAALVHLAASSIGFSNLRLLSRATGVSYPKVRRFAKNLRENGIWGEDGRIAIEADPNEEPETAAVAFWLHVLVAVGRVRRQQPDEARAEQAAYGPGERLPVPDEQGEESNGSTTAKAAVEGGQ